MNHRTAMSQCVEALGADYAAAGLFREVRRISVDADRVAQEMGWHVIDDILGTATFEPNMIRLVGAAGRVEPATYMTSRMSAGDVVHRSIAAKPFHRALKGGATLIVNKADRLHPVVRANRERLEYWVSEIAWCNAYAAWSDSSAFGRHSDDHDVLVIQAEGAKDWTVHSPDGAEVLDGTLTPGDVLHIPRGWDHQVVGRGGPSLHWTFGFRRPTVAELAGDVLKESGVGAGAVRWETDGRLSALDRADIRRFAETLAGWTDEADGPGRHAAMTERREGASLPWAISPKAWDRATVRWAARLPPVIEYRPDGVDLATLGRRYRLDRRLESVLRALETGESVGVRDLMLVTPLDADGLGAFLDFAVSEEILIAERAPLSEREPSSC